MEYENKDLATLLPIPAHNANKTSRGKLIVIAGGTEDPGAAVLTSYSGQRTGAGSTEALTASNAVQSVQLCRPSLTVSSWENLEDYEFMASKPEQPCAYVVGPGFEKGTRETTTVTYLILGKAKAPVLLDSASLLSMSKPPGRALCKNRFVEGHETVITVDSENAECLATALKLSTDDPAHLAYDLSLGYGVTTVLKGSVTYISDGEEVFAIASESSALLKVDSNDVLAGILGSLLAQGLGTLDASILGVSLYAQAGILASNNLTSVSVIAEDIIDYIPKAIKCILEAANRPAA